MGMREFEDLKPPDGSGVLHEQQQGKMALSVGTSPCELARGSTGRELSI